jgi:tetratricopeptide (TPR) repeat protein
VVSDDAALKKGQVGSRSPGNRVYVTPALIGLNVIVFGLMVGNGVPALEPAPHSMLDWGADFGPLTLGGQWWRMLSSIFLHRGIFHLLGNMIVLASIGRFMEKVLGNAAYLILYLVAGIAQCDRAIQLNPKFAEAYCNRGVAKAKKGDLDGALIDCDRAIELNPKLAGAYSSRGSIEAQKGDFEASIRDCDRAIQLEPERGELYTVRGAAKAKKGDLSGAMADCDRAIQLDPKLVPAYSLRAAVREKNSDLEGAVADWNQAIQLNPKVTEANPSLAVAYYNRGSTFRGKKEYERRSAITVKRFV